MAKKHLSASEIDGVQYRRAKLWQIICYACNGFVGMSVYSLIGMVLLREKNDKQFQKE